MTITDREVIEEFRDQQKLAQTGGQMIGGGPGQSDMDSAGGSSGTGGYGNAQNQQSHQGQNEGPDSQSAPGTNPDGLSRGERFDLEQGGGRGPDELDRTNELEVDQQAHQHRGQSVAEEQEESGERP
jgi:hypothetical protein